MNTFMNGLQNATNFTRTDNGALAHRTTNSAVYDMFAFGGAMRKCSDEDVILRFKKAFEEHQELALKCLFYLRDARGGQGERRFFRVCYKWLCSYDKETAVKFLNLIAEYGRWDDLVYVTLNTPLFPDAVKIIRKQLNLDVECKTPSLLGKWLPSENASSAKTKKAATQVRIGLNLSHKQYRKILSSLRKKINIVERLMSENRWDEIEFDKLPSKAGLIYKNAFARRDILKEKYAKFAKSEKTTVNASTLYPYEVVAKAKDCYEKYRWAETTSETENAATDRAMIEKYWNNLPDYLNGKPCKMMCVVDTSGSMTGRSASAPIKVAISLGMYCAERAGGPFKNHYISFASAPQLIDIEGIDFVDKVMRIYRTNLCDNTDLLKTFELVKQVAKNCNPEDVPETLVVISDMQIDNGTAPSWYGRQREDYIPWTRDNTTTEMEKLRREWAREGLKLPKLVYWNVNASNPVILEDGPDVSYVSGCSPVLFEQVLTGKTGYDLMIDKLLSKRYEAIKL